MSLLDVVQAVCQVVGVEQLSTVFGNLPANRTQQEMLALANEMAQRIAWNTRDWTRISARTGFMGDGVKTAFTLPDNYVRMLKDANVWKSGQPNIPMVFISSLDDWLRREMQSYWPYAGQWIINNGQMLIQPPLGLGITVEFTYLHSSIINRAVGAPDGSDHFIADDDKYALDERLLKLGMIWQWKANKGSPYAEDMATYETALARAAGSDAPAPIIIDTVPISQTTNATIAYPWPVPTP